MNDELDKSIADVSAHIVCLIDESRLICIDGIGGAFERFGKHRDIGPALNEIGKAARGAARQDRDRDPGQLLDLGFVRIHQAERDGRGAVNLHVRVGGKCRNTQICPARLKQKGKGIYPNTISQNPAPKKKGNVTYKSGGGGKLCYNIKKQT